MEKLFKGFGHKLLGKLRSDKAENTITMMIAFPLLWAIIMTILDFGIFMQDRTMLVSDLREGARTVAIFGGTDKSKNALINAYGTTCELESGIEHDKDDSATDMVGCLVANQIKNNKGYSQITISDIQCGVVNPDHLKYHDNPKDSDGKIDSDYGKITGFNEDPKASVKIGQAVSCAAHYQYQGFPGSALGLLGGNFMMGKGDKNLGTDPVGSTEKANYEIQNSHWNEGTVIVSAQSEVTMNN